MKENEPPNKAAQIEALIRHEAYELVMKHTPPDMPSADSYREIFTVIRNDIEGYLKQNYELNDLIVLETGPQDGFYAIPVPGGYHTYEQERGIAFEESIVQSEDEVWSQYIEYLIRTSGTGVEFT